MEISQKFSLIMQEKKFTKKNLLFIVQGFYNNTITKQQMSEFLMYVYNNGLTDRQTFNLTTAMMSAGQMLDLSTFKLSVDKHSTGGVSDSTTLIVVPLFALLGFNCYKMSGGALGHTGGTADKLLQFKNININLDTVKAVDITKKHGGCFTTQTQDFAPIDKKIYALRDSIGAVQSIPLIASSIMSKKLAGGASNIVLDVKYGEGALIKDKKQATKLAKLMCKIGKFYNRDVRYVLGDMNAPLGMAVGDKYEVGEVLYLLKNYSACSLLHHSIHLVCQFADKINLTYEQCYDECEKLIKGGKVLQKLEQIIFAQGGKMPKIQKIQDLKGVCIQSDISGTLMEIKTAELGNLFHKNKTSIDGGYLYQKIGEKIQKGQSLIKVFGNPDKNLLDKIKEIFVIK